MKRIRELIELTDGALVCAKNFADRYLEHKAFKDYEWAEKFKAMALDEMMHAIAIHSLVHRDAESLSEVEVPTEIKNEWAMFDKEYDANLRWLNKLLK